LKQAVYDIFTPQERGIDLKSHAFGEHFTNQDPDEIIQLTEDELFGSKLHPAHGAFFNADMPSPRQLAMHQELAWKQKSGKQIKEEQKVAGEEEEASNLRQRDLQSSPVLFVKNDTRMNAIGYQLAPNTHNQGDTSANIGHSAQKDDTAILPDDTDYDSDVYGFDEPWDAASECSTEPGDEYSSDKEEAEIGDIRSRRSTKRTIAEVEMSDEDVESPSPKKKFKSKKKVILVYEMSKRKRK
jgi:hypothetical protein